VGAAAGGIFFTQDGGLSWKPIFEKESTASIGAIALAPSNPNLVWIGTGEKNIRNDVVTGKGVYFLLTPAQPGSSWAERCGTDLEHRDRPKDPNNVFVAVLGHAWGPNAERGIFRTTDGGATWKKVLFVDEETGASSLVMQPAIHGALCRNVACAAVSLGAGRWRRKRRHLSHHRRRQYLEETYGRHARRH